MSEKIGRRLWPVVLAFGLTVGAAAALDNCVAATCAPPPSCYSCAGSPPPMRTSLPGYYSGDYDYSESARYPNGVTYLIPTQAGLIESPVVPLLNPVDRYYATHHVRNGQVVDESPSYGMALAVPRYVNPDGTQGALAFASETYDRNEYARMSGR